jgi:PAS domain S-box-containing protein
MHEPHASSADLLMQALMGSFPDLAFLLDEHDVFLAFHAPAPEKLMMPPEAFLGKSAGQVLPPQLWGECQLPVTEVRQTGQPRTVRYGFDSPDGYLPFEARLLPAGGGRVLCLARDVRALVHAEERSRRQVLLLDELRQIHMISTSGGRPHEVFPALLRVMLRATNSAFGFLAEAVELGGEVLLRVRATQDFSRTPAQHQVYEAVLVGSVLPANSLCGSVMQGLVPVCLNDVSVFPGALGLPPGHPPLRTFLGVPFFLEGRLRGVIGLANRAAKYTDEDLLYLEPFLGSCAHLVAFFQSERERVQAERLNERYQNLFEASNVNMAILSREGRFLACNPAFQRTLGWSHEELVRRRPMELIPSEDWARIREQARALMSGEEVKGLEARFRKKDGSFCWMLGSGVHDPEQGFIYIAAIDITEQKLRERQSQERLRLLEMAEQLSGVGTWYWDCASDRVLWSPVVCQIHGVEPGFSPLLEEAIAFYHPEDLPTVETLVARAIQRAEAYSFELRIISRSGETRWVAASGRPELDATGRVIALQGVFQDITRQKQTQRELTKLANVANRTHNAVVISDSKGRIEWVNKGFTEMTGYALEECQGRTPGSLLQGPDSNPATVNYMRECLEQRRGFRAQVLNYHKSGRPYWVEVEVQPVFDSAGALTNFIAIETDISKHKEVEQQLIAAREAAEHVSRLKSQFLANMSHEIRTPLHGILGFTDMLLDVPELPDSARETVECIESSGKVLLATINDILDFSKIEAGRLDMEQVPFALHQLAEDSLRLFVNDANDKGLFLKLEFAPGLPVNWIGDPVRVRQVLINLLSNAIKFTSTGGISVRFTREPSGALLGEVRDTGPGVPDDQKQYIFEAFIQADGSTTRKYGGSGLGLAICRDLVARMSGRIWCEDGPEGGARFLFQLGLPVAPEGVVPSTPPPRELPRRRAKDTSAPAMPVTISEAPGPPLAPALKAPGLILLAEDNVINARFTRKLLEKEGYLVQVVGNGQEAVDAWRRGGVALILMDVQMPLMDGLEATRSIRDLEAKRLLPELERLPGARVPIIALTANAMRSDEQLCLAAGMDGYLTKPFERDDLLQLLTRIVGGAKKKC